MPRYSLRDLFGFTAMCGVGCLLLLALPAFLADMREMFSRVSIPIPSFLKSPGVVGTAIFLLAFTFAVYRTSRRPRQFLWGFLTAAWAYFVFVNASPPSLQNQIWTERLILWELARSNPSSWEAHVIICHPGIFDDLRTVPAIDWFLAIGHFIWMLIVGGIGGMLGLVFAPRTTRSALDSR